MSEPATTTVATSDKANCHLQDDKLLYSSFDAFMAAIQDSGKEKTKSKKKSNDSGVMIYPTIKKICIKNYEKILIRHKERLPALDKNENCRAQKLKKVILLNCNKRGASDVHESYKKFGLKEVNSIYVITNEPNLFGLDIVLDLFENHIAQAVTKSQQNWTPDDVLCVV